MPLSEEEFLKTYQPLSGNQSSALERAAFYGISAPFEASAQVQDAISVLTSGAPARTPEERAYGASLGAPRTGPQAVTDFIGHLLPIIPQTMAVGGLTRGVLGAADIVSPAATEIATGASELGWLGAGMMGDRTAATEQAGEGAVLGLARSLPMRYRLPLVAALSLGSKKFFDYRYPEEAAAGGASPGNISAAVNAAFGLAGRRVPWGEAPTTMTGPEGVAAAAATRTTIPGEYPMMTEAGVRPSPIPALPVEYGMMTGREAAAPFDTTTGLPQMGEIHGPTQQFNPLDPSGRFAFERPPSTVRSAEEAAQTFTRGGQIEILPSGAPAPHAPGFPTGRGYEPGGVTGNEALLQSLQMEGFGPGAQRPPGISSELGKSAEESAQSIQELRAIQGRAAKEEAEQAAMATYSGQQRLQQMQNVPLMLDLTGDLVLSGPGQGGTILDVNKDLTWAQSWGRRSTKANRRALPPMPNEVNPVMDAMGHQVSKEFVENWLVQQGIAREHAKELQWAIDQIGIKEHNVQVRKFYEILQGDINPERDFIPEKPVAGRTISTAERQVLENQAGEQARFKAAYAKLQEAFEAQTALTESQRPPPEPSPEALPQRKGKIRRKPEYRRTEGGGFGVGAGNRPPSESAPFDESESLFRSLGIPVIRGVAGAAFAGGAAAIDPDQTIDPRMAAAVGFLTAAFGRAAVAKIFDSVPKIRELVGAATSSEAGAIGGGGGKKIIESGIIPDKTKQFAAKLQSEISDRVAQMKLDVVPSGMKKGDLFYSKSSGRQYEFVGDGPINKSSNPKYSGPSVYYRDPFSGDEGTMMHWGIDWEKAGLEQPTKSVREIQETFATDAKAPTETKPRIISTALKAGEGEPLQGMSPSDSHQDVLAHHGGVEGFLEKTGEVPDLNAQGGFMIREPDGTVRFASREETTPIGHASEQIPKSYTGPAHSQIVKWDQPSGMKSKIGRPGEESASILPETSFALIRAALGAGVGGAIGGLTDDRGSHTGLVTGAMFGAALGLGGPALVGSIIHRLAQMKTPIATDAKASLAMKKSWKVLMEERTGAVLVGSDKTIDRFANWLDRNLHLSLPEEVKRNLTYAKGAVNNLLDIVDSAIQKTGYFKPTQDVRDAANSFLDGEISVQDFLAKLPNNAEHEAYAKFIVSSRQAVDGLQKLLLTGLGDSPLRKVIEDSIGKYLTRSYRIFTDPKWQPSEHTIVQLAQEIQDRGLYAGATTEEITTRLRQHVREIKSTKGLFRSAPFSGEGEAIVPGSPGGGTASSAGFRAGEAINQAILKKRVEGLSWRWKQFLGEIEDPTERIYQTIFRIRPMSEASNYFSRIVKGEKSAEGTPHFFSNHMEKKTYQNAIERQIRDGSLSPETGQLILTKLEQYQYVHSDERFGALQAGLVSRPVWETLKTYDSMTSTFNSPLMRGITNGHNAIKMMRTAYNPLTVIRNYMSAPVFAFIAKAEPMDLVEAVKILYNTDHPLRREVVTNGILGSDQVKNEFFREFEGATRNTWNLGSLDLTQLSMGRVDLDIAEHYARKGIRNWLDIYRLPDNAVRVGAYISAKRRIATALGKEMDHPDVINRAVDFVNRYTMNYDAVAPIIKVGRQLPFTNLFLSYTAEMARIGKNLVQDVIVNDTKGGARHDRLWAAAPLATLALLPELWQSASESELSERDRADWEKVKKLQPSYGRNRFFRDIHRLPSGEFKYTDFSPLIASDSFNIFMRHVLAGDMKAALATNPIAQFDNTPALNIAAQLVTGRPTNSYREHRNWQDYVAGFAREVMPPWLPPGAEFERAQLAYTKNDKGEYGLTDKNGRRITPTDFWQPYFLTPGQKGYSVHLQQVQKKAEAQAKNAVANEVAYLNDVLKSDDNQVNKARAVERAREAIATIREGYFQQIGYTEP